jgi:hypothetical protein
MSEQNPAKSEASNVVDSLYKELGIGSLLISQRLME